MDTDGATPLKGDARRRAEEKIAEELHERYRATARRVGWPMKPAIDCTYDCTYDKLTEEAKELDRVLARWHLDAVAQAVANQRVLLEAYQTHHALFHPTCRIDGPIPVPHETTEADFYGQG